MDLTLNSTLWDLFHEANQIVMKEADREIVFKELDKVLHDLPGVIAYRVLHPEK